MPKSANYKGASGAYSAATQYGVGADAMASKRRTDEEIYNIKSDQMHTAFGAASEVVGIGKNLWDTYSHNKEQMSKAKDLGLGVKSGWLGQLFGDVEYEDSVSGETVSGDMIEAVTAWDNFYEGDNIMSSLLKRKQEARTNARMKEASQYNPKMDDRLLGSNERMG